MAEIIQQKRAEAALKNMFIADALAMPVHWFYNPLDIEKAFPGGIFRFEAAPDFHPSSIMSLHSTVKGGRGSQQAKHQQRQIVGDVILKGRRKYWGVANQHYHQGMQAGENTLNAHCARVVLRSLAANGGLYHKEVFLDNYIDFMTSDPPQHPDTYAESYHRGFFANLEVGKAKDRCAAVTHDTPSIGGLVTIAPILLSERLRGRPLIEAQGHCLKHLFLTHPDKNLGHICAIYVELLDALLFRDDNQSALDLLARAAKSSIGLDLPALVENTSDDMHVVGGLFSSACYIQGAWPSLLYLAYKYSSAPRQALLVNTNLGGDNVHRGIVLGTLLGLMNAATVNEWFEQLIDKELLSGEIDTLLTLSHSEG
ncbi:ADP-ribosylglycohydrolase [Malonomonas rubra DSM 5091]|uniref:ADP-ribosylglycohydrolase n=1 Tax=Malonomonas rubra DSM 5091 TaxID=1122189 RepID=A0A1M6G354_MALRU|nr:ADP-ribosylglycohydrolase family protein [Malonomonas rubra]SHJ04350.1 ADP-ribosylglycohydrolase [Malonomonas rubra DSM 5091]